MSYFNKNKGLSIALLILVILNIATLTTFWVLKEKQNGPGGKPNSGVADFLANELKFDSIQKKSLLQLRDEHILKSREIRRGNRDAKETFFELLKQPNISDSIVALAVKQSLRFDEQLELLNFHHFQQIRNLCNEAQKKKFDEIIQSVLRMMAPPRPGEGQPPPSKNGRPPREGEPIEPPLPPAKN